MRPGFNKCKKVRISRSKLQKQIAAAESKGKVLEKYYKGRLNLQEQEHKKQLEEMARSIVQLKEDKGWMLKIIMEYQEQKKRLENENKLLYQMLEKKPTLLDKIKKKLPK